VTPTDVHARQLARQQRAGDAVVLLVLVTQQAVRVVQLECQADHGRDRRQGDVALGEVEAEADDFLALVHALAHDAGVGDGAGVRTRHRRGQCEARHIATVGQARQVMVLLLLGAVAVQEFGGPERVRHRDDGRGHRGPRRDLDQHLGVSVGGELLTAVLLLDDHGEEAVLLQVVPDLGRQVAVLVGDLPLVEHAAQGLDLVVDEALFLGRQLRLRHREQLVPVRVAGEQVAVPPHRAGLQRIALGLRHLRHDAAIGIQRTFGQPVPAQHGHVERHGDEAERTPGEQQPAEAGVADRGPQQQHRAHREGAGGERGASVGEGQGDAEEQGEPEQGGHEGSLGRRVYRI
jgi:hypothetical protein